MVGRAKRGLVPAFMSSNSRPSWAPMLKLPDEAVAAIDHRVRTLLDDQGECAAVDLEWRIAPSTPIRSTRSIHQSPGGNNSFGVISGNFDCKEDEISISADIDFPIDNTKSENSSEERLF